MALAFDASSTSNQQLGVSTFSWLHTVTGSNPILRVAVTSSDGSFSGVTANGVAMTLVDTAISGVHGWGIAHYILTNPATGSITIAVTLGTAAGRSLGTAESYTGARQSSQPDSHNVSNSGTNSVTMSTTVVSTGCWLVGAVAAVTGAGSQSAGAGTTLRQNIGMGSGNSGASSDSNGTVSTGSQSLVHTSASSNDMMGVVMSIAPFVPAVASAGFFENFV